MNYEKLLTSKQKLYLKNLYFTIKLRILNTVREQIKTDKKVDLNDEKLRKMLECVRAVAHISGNVMLGKFAEDLYREYVKKFGPFKDFTLTEDEAKTFRAAWTMIGTGWVTEQVDYAPDGDRVIVRAYYGSSRYNSKQMARLIDMVVEDAKELDIETLSPEELARLKEGWHGGA